MLSSFCSGICRHPCLREIVVVVVVVFVVVVVVLFCIFFTDVIRGYRVLLHLGVTEYDRVLRLKAKQDSDNFGYYRLLMYTYVFCIFAQRSQLIDLFDSSYNVEKNKHFRVLLQCSSSGDYK